MFLLYTAGHFKGKFITAQGRAISSAENVEIEALQAPRGILNLDSCITGNSVSALHSAQVLRPVN